MTTDASLPAKRRSIAERFEREFVNLPPSLRQRTAQMQDWLRSTRNPIVAFSGGVDSAVVAGLLSITRPEPPRLLTAVGPALAQRQREFAAEVAGFLAADHQWIDAGEIENEDYLRNDSRRCFHCKSSLYSAIQRYQNENRDRTLLNGTNQDDLGDYRPGLQAASDFGVKSPLADFGICKSEVRLLADAMQLPVAQLPAAPCLASRIQYGVPVTADRLRIIESAEQLLWSMDFSDVRIRLMEGEVASLEVPAPEVARLKALVPVSIESDLLSVGFSKVVIQTDGLKSGRLNDELLQLKANNRTQ